MKWRLLLWWWRMIGVITHPLWLLKFRQCQRSGHVWTCTGIGHNYEFGVTERAYECRRCGACDSSV